MFNQIYLSELQIDLLREIIDSWSDDNVNCESNVCPDVATALILKHDRVVIENEQIVYFIMVAVNQRRIATWSQDFDSEDTRRGRLKITDNLYKKFREYARGDYLFLGVLRKFNEYGGNFSLPNACMIELNGVFKGIIARLYRIVLSEKLSVASQPLNLPSGNFRYDFVYPSSTYYSVTTELFVSDEFFWLEGFFNDENPRNTLCFQTEKIALADLGDDIYHYPDIELPTNDFLFEKSQQHERYIENISQTLKIYEAEIDKLNAYTALIKAEYIGISRHDVPSFVLDDEKMTAAYDCVARNKEAVDAEIERLFELTRHLTFSASMYLFNISIGNIISFYDHRGFYRRVKVSDISLHITDAETSLSYNGQIINKAGKLTKSSYHSVRLLGGDEEDG